MKDIEPNPKLNKVFAGLLALLAAFPLFLGFNSMTFLPPEEWTWSAVPIGIGVLILVPAALAWRRPPMNAARIVFHDGGFRLETRQVFRGEKTFDLSWSEVSEVSHTNGGLYGGRWIRVFHGPGKDNAMFAPAWTNSDAKEIIGQLEASAGAAGYVFERETGFWKGLVRERWIVRKRP